MISTTTWSRSRLSRNQLGLATVEFALTAPVLLLLMFATAELGRLLYQYNTLNEQVRDAVRYAAAAVATSTGSTGTVSISNAVRIATQNLVVYGTPGAGSALLPGLNTANVTVGSTAAGYVSVSAAYTYQPVIGSSLPTFGLGANINLNMVLNASAVMKVL